MRRKTSDIPDPVKAAFAKATHLRTFSMAEPGTRWQATDVIIWPRLPSRRLIGVAVGRSCCLIFYERGGFGESNNLAVFRLPAGIVETLGHSYLDPETKDPTALRAAIEAGKVSGLGSRFF